MAKATKTMTTTMTSQMIASWLKTMGCEPGAVTPEGSGEVSWADIASVVPCIVYQISALALNTVVVTFC